MKKIIILGLGVFFLLHWLSAAAEEGGHYQIELLVFSQAAVKDTTSSQIESKIQWPTAMTELSDSLKTDNKSLQDEAAKLLNLPGYQTILQLSWRQSKGLGGAILPMHIKSQDGRLDGYVQLRNLQGFELIIDLECKSLKINPAGKPYLFHVNEKRLAKFNEVHYFDNPNIGVLVKVSEG